MDFKAPAKSDIVALHLGHIGRKQPVELADITWKLNDLGWYSGTQLTEHFGEQACKEFGKAIDKKRGR
jgi:hypothetical protein